MLPPERRPNRSRKRPDVSPALPPGRPARGSPGLPLATGWGRRLASRLLEAGNGPKLSEELAEAMDTIFGASIPAYQGYFGLLGEEEAGSSQKRRELRRQMPIAVTR